MAGIGFRLQALADRGDLLGPLRAYGYSSFLVAGPWLFTVLALLGITYVLSPTTSWEEIQNFRSIVIYNFCLTLIATGPVVLAGTRYVADQIYAKDLTFIPFSLMSSLAIVAVLTGTVGAGFHIGALDLPLGLRLMGLVNFGLVAAIWVTIPFLTIVRGYRSVALAFALGCLATVLLTYLLNEQLDDVQILAIFNAALTGILMVVMYRIGREYPNRIVVDRGWAAFLHKRWELLPIGLLYYLGIWIDKLIMWHSDSGDTVVIGRWLSTLPIYDSAMFKAQLLAIPAFVIFFVHIETGFYSKFRNLYGSFERHATLGSVEKAIEQIGNYVFVQLLHILALLSLLAALLIIFLPGMHEALGLESVQLGIFRIGLIGTMLHTTFLIAIVFLLYFDLRTWALILTTVFFLSNALLTLWFQPLGLAWYGYGYMLAAAIALLLTTFVLLRELPWLAYHAFVTNNESL